ncbi:HEPN domain-containing protein [Larkinella humicola]|uniref:HEPN domain-containing protein n=1 Tax=Larkinella humicola TaxID=2607654 RepID=A0A5N1JMC4_9BACT|nr:HEPN domain-containing protein [Larkinella humicola]KAA9354836.1 HEPN domain-containing protein [Larkinella humicola]
MMNGRLLKQISEVRIKEAAVLLSTKNYCGAYYLAGYAIECALKACIAQKTKRHDFPDKNFAQKCYTHDLKELVKLADLEAQRLNLEKHNSTFATNWTIVKDWNESSRYRMITKAEAKNLLDSVTDPISGILIWIQHYW